MADPKSTPIVRPSLASQAQTILEAATSLQQQLESASLPQPSFAPDGRRDWHDASHLPSLLETRLKLIDAAQSMLDLVVGPLDTLVYLAGPANTKIEVLRTLDELRVADNVPLEGEISVDELAGNLSVNRGSLERHLRCAYLMGIFRESREGHVAHTGVSAAMPSFSPYTRLRLSELLQRGTFHVAESMRLSAEQKGGKVPIPIELADKDKGGRDMWKQLTEDDPDGKGMEKFSTAMRVLGAAHSGGSYVSFVQGFDWDRLPDGPIVDIGGGNGHISVNVAKALPASDFIIQDLESNAAPARDNIKQHGLETRVKFQTQDFFNAQPADLRPSAYLVSRVLHDWQDEDCVKILRPLLPAMEKYGTKLLIVERVLPDRVGEMSPYKEWSLRMTDILMYTLFSAKERSLKDFEALLRKVDDRLRIASCRTPASTIFGFMEVNMVS